MPYSIHKGGTAAPHKLRNVIMGLLILTVLALALLLVTVIVIDFRHQDKKFAAEKAARKAKTAKRIAGLDAAIAVTRIHGEMINRNYNLRMNNIMQGR
jgi:uncharacterized membrane protein